MKKNLFLIFTILWVGNGVYSFAQKPDKKGVKEGKPVNESTNNFYLNNKAPLRPNPYLELPLGAIKPQGWLKEMLVRQKNGATGQLDKLDPLVMNNRNGWLGGDGDKWERGPYWRQAQGLYGGDEALHGSNPTQGSELCTAVELMFSLESMLGITGQVSFADHLEKITFNALPTQTTDDYLARQYFQQANQVMLTRHIRNFNENHGGTDACYGLLTGYPCCTSNMHQGWPKFTQNLWYATPDNGLAALVYSPSEVKAKVAGGTEVKWVEETNYPFSETIKFTLTTSKKAPVSFPFHLRIPEWCRKATISINGKTWQEATGNQIVVVNREWKSGDLVQLQLPMHLFKTKWYENPVAVERGPITYALKIGEDWKTVQNEKDPIWFGKQYIEVRPTTPWNYGLLPLPDRQLAESFKIVRKEQVAAYPWTVAEAPIEIKVKAKRIPSW